MVVPPATGSPVRRRSLVPWVIGLAAAGIVLCGLVAAGVWIWRSRQMTTSITPTVAVTAESAAVYLEVDESTRKALEDSVGRIEAAFRAGDVEAVKNLTHPAVQSSYLPIFEEHRNELDRVADLLKTRRLVAATYDMAEYEVTENGRTFTVTFEPWGETWYLSSL